MPDAQTPRTADDLGLMRGFPPSPDRLVTHQNQLYAPYNRWSFQNELALNRTVDVWRRGADWRQRTLRGLGGTDVCAHSSLGLWWFRGPNTCAALRSPAGGLCRAAGTGTTSMATVEGQRAWGALVCVAA